MKTRVYDPDDLTEEFYLYKRIEGLTASMPDAINTGYGLIEQNIVPAIDRLPQNFYLLIMLRDVNGHSYQQIAFMTKQSVESVINNINLARKYLQKLIWDQISSSALINTESEKQVRANGI